MMNMANKSLRLDYNAPGAYYVTEDCIDCDLCRNLAPGVFQREDSSGYSYVVRQPSNLSEGEAVEEAVQCCPVEAIGNDG